MSLIRSVLFLVSCFALASCSNPKVVSQVADTYSTGDADKASQLIEKEISKKHALKNIKDDRNSALYLMHGAWLMHSLGNYNQSLLEYQKMLEAIDYYKQESALENIETLLLDDTRSAFSGDIFEQLLGRLFFALCLQQAKQPDNSAALLRQYQEAYSLVKEEMSRASFMSHIEPPKNPLASYLLGCQLESKGDYSNAKILFESSKIENQNKEFLKKEISSIGKRSKKAWVVVLVHLGQVPEKIQGYAVGASASMLALEAYLDSRQIDPAWSSLTGIAVPEYRDRWNTKLKPFSIEVGSTKVPSFQMLDITKIAQSELNQKLPVITAKALARQLSRRAIVYKEYTKSESAGMAADLLLLCANLSTSADLRSWSILPSEIWLARHDMTPGQTKLKIEGLPDIVLDVHEGLNLIEVFAPSKAWVLFEDKKWGPFSLSDREVTPQVTHSTKHHKTLLHVSL